MGFRDGCGSVEAHLPQTLDSDVKLNCACYFRLGSAFKTWMEFSLFFSVVKLNGFGLHMSFQFDLICRKCAVCILYCDSKFSVTVILVCQGRVAH